MALHQHLVEHEEQGLLRGQLEGRRRLGELIERQHLVKSRHGDMGTCYEQEANSSQGHLSQYIYIYYYYYYYRPYYY